MIIKDAMQSLRNDPLSSIFYWITFVVTSMFIFLFLTVSMSDVIGVTFYQAESNTATCLAVASCVLCMLEIVFANDFFARTKAKELGVRLVCGATYVQLAEYLLIQSVVLMLIAIPAGIIFGWLGLGVINVIRVVISPEMAGISLSGEAVIWTTSVIGYTVFWTLIFNLAFAYRSSAAELFNTSGIRNPSSGIFSFSFAREKSKKTKDKILYVLAWIAFAVPLALFYHNVQGLFPFALISLIGFLILMKYDLMRKSDQHIHKRQENSLKLACLGFVRHDIQVVWLNIVLLSVTAILLISTIGPTMQEGETVLILMTYVLLNCMLCLAVFFRFCSDLTQRKAYFRTLEHLGYLRSDLRHMIHQETILFYVLNLSGTLLYLIPLCISLVYNHILAPVIVLGIPVGFILPVIITMIVTMVVYQKNIMGK